MSGIGPRQYVLCLSREAHERTNAEHAEPLVFSACPAISALIVTVGWRLSGRARRDPTPRGASRRRRICSTSVFGHICNEECYIFPTLRLTTPRVVDCRRSLQRQHEVHPRVGTRWQQRYETCSGGSLCTRPALTYDTSSTRCGRRAGKTRATSRAGWTGRPTGSGGHDPDGSGPAALSGPASDRRYRRRRN